MTALQLLPVTTITARSGQHFARVELDNRGSQIEAAVTAKIAGHGLGPIKKSLSASANQLAVAGAVGSLLKQGLDWLAPKPAEYPDGLPIEITVNDGVREFSKLFYLDLNLNSLAKFTQIIEWTRSVTDQARGHA